MRTRITPHLVELTYSATLNAFWRRIALSRFLRECGISANFLGTWQQEETKRVFLDRLFDYLPRKPAGQKVLLKMAKSLSEMDSFPDLRNWEDSDEKIKAAKDAVNSLKSYLQKQETEIEREESKAKAKEEFVQKQNDIARSQTTLVKLNDQLNKLGSRLGEQKAGYEFQDWFYELTKFSDIDSRRPYVSKGRQIDGSITLDGTTYLVELKFTAGQAGATDIDSFYKKVVTKAENTMGIMLSISGFSSVAIDEASGERTPILLMDHSHLYLVLGGMMGLSEVINRLRRHASQTGEAYLPVSQFG